MRKSCASAKTNSIKSIALRVERELTEPRSPFLVFVQISKDYRSELLDEPRGFDLMLNYYDEAEDWPAHGRLYSTSNGHENHSEFEKFSKSGPISWGDMRLFFFWMMISRSIVRESCGYLKQ